MYQVAACGDACSKEQRLSQRLLESTGKAWDPTGRGCMRMKHVKEEEEDYGGAELVSHEQGGGSLKKTYLAQS